MNLRRSAGTILDEILDHKEREVAEAKTSEPPEAMAQRAASAANDLRGFRQRLLEGPAPAVIAELKRRSPSKGLIREDFEPVRLAREYVRGGAACLSVLTDQKFFGGELAFLEKVRAAVDLPLLRKDFVIDAYQIDEARAAGADCVLLIAAALTADGMASLNGHARRLGLDVLVEVHDEEELEMALALDPDLLGVNNRNLKTFEVDLATTERLAARISERLARDRCDAESDRGAIVLVAESGIATNSDIARLESSGACAFLVGESLMRETDIARALARLRSKA